MASFKYVRETTAVVIRKGVTIAGAPLGGWPVAGRSGQLAYAFEIREVGEESKTRTVYLDYSRSKDFYRVPVGQPLKLRIGREGTKIGHWVESWSPVVESSSPAVESSSPAVESSSPADEGAGRS
jgi:hypothetical protein